MNRVAIKIGRGALRKALRQFCPIAVALLAGSLSACGTSSIDDGATALAPTEQRVGVGGAGVVKPSAAIETGSTASNGKISRETRESSLKPAKDASVSLAGGMPATGAVETSSYKIGTGDMLDISVFKVPELSKSVQVAATGSVNLPLVGEVPVAGRTPQEVERELTAKLGAKYLQSPQVTVLVKEYNSQKVTVEGSVKKPGVYPFRGNTTLLQLVATAEGLTETADFEVAVFRDVNGKKEAAKFALDDIRGGKAQDPALRQGDLVIVNTSMAKQAFQNLLKVVPLANVFVPVL